MNRSSRLSSVYQLIIYLSGFLLFWEWLRPLAIITDTGNLSLFIVYAAFCFFLSFINVKWWLSILLKLAGAAFILDGLFIQEVIFSPVWFFILMDQIQFNIAVILNQEWIYLTPLFRSLLFLLLLWLMSYLLHYWFVIANRIFLFILLTFIYITVLDTFTIYNANYAIVRTFIISLIAMGVSSFTKELDREAMMQLSKKKIFAWIFPLVSMILFFTLVGFASPKLEPQWPDPVPFITSTAQNAGINEGAAGGMQKVGYGENDSSLGGSFVQDYTPVFQAAVQKKHYWRIESKDFYTGKGWERSERMNLQEQVGGRINLQTFEDTVETEHLQAMVKYDQAANFTKVVYPYGIKSIDAVSQVNYLLDQETGTIEAEGPEQPDLLGRYQVNYQYPSFSIDALSSAGTNDPEEIKSLYLQLPNNLPERIKDLAEEIVANDQTRYDKVKTVESYFGENGYTYQITDVATPERGQDYVDQFLFDTKIGYCDNFSTSMVVMLRSLDIPARWVKGFTGGERLEQQPTDVPEGMDVYQITNANAHSWVEVYFPEIGWVPFEPTSGFSSSVNFFQETTATPEEQQPEVQPEQEEQETPEEEEAEVLEEAQEKESTGNTQDTQLSFWTWFVPLLIFIGITSVVYASRYRWMTLFLIRRYKKHTSVQAYQDAYQYLLKILEHKGLGRTQGQTLREYAKYIDHRLQTGDMSELTLHYERVLYRNEADYGQWQKMTELWENLIKRSLS